MNKAVTPSRLDTEIRLLYIREGMFKLPAAPIIRQLVAWEEMPLPDSFPAQPEWREFAWPESSRVNFEDYWRARDGGVAKRWAGPYL
jgi:hypothetical protein